MNFPVGAAAGRPTPAPAPSSFILGHFPDFQRDPLGFLRRAWEANGDVVAFRFGWRRLYLVAHPEGVCQVLTNYPERYDKRVVSYQRMRRLGGDGLVSSDGDLWKWQHQAAQPAFEHQRIRSLAPVIL